jgi:hypothetical protein
MTGEVWTLREDDGTETRVDADAFWESVKLQVAELGIMRRSTGNDFAKEIGGHLTRVHREQTPGYERLWAGSVARLCCQYMMFDATTFNLSWYAQNLAGFCVLYRLERPVADDDSPTTVVDPADATDDPELLKRAVDTVQAMATSDDDRAANTQMQLAKVAAPDKFDEYAGAVATLTARYVIGRAEASRIQPIMDRYRSLVFTFRGLRHPISET